MKYSDKDFENAIDHFKEPEIEALALILQSLYKGSTTIDWNAFPNADMNAVKTLAFGYDVIVESPNGFTLGNNGKVIMNPEKIGPKASNVGKIINSIILPFLNYHTIAHGKNLYFKNNYGLPRSAYYRKPE